MELYLWINEKWERVDGNNTICFNYTFNALANPTLYVGEYCYTVEVPKTAHNNKLFYHIGVLDSLETEAKSMFEYMVVGSGEVVSRGSAIVTEVNNRVYVLQLDGSLYNCLTKLYSAGWGEGSTYRMPELWGTLRLSTNIVNTSFNTDAPLWDTSTLPQFGAFTFPHIAGFMPTNNITMEGFEAGSWTDGNSVLELEEDMTQQQMAEFRVTRLRPYIYVDKLWKAYSTECESVTGYKMELDTRWYNENNTMLKGVVYTLPRLDDTYKSSTNQYSHNLSVGNNWWEYTQTIVSPYTVTATSPNRPTFEYALPMVFQFDGRGLYDAFQSGVKVCFDDSYYVLIKATVRNATTVYYEQTNGFMIEPGYKNDSGNYLLSEINQAVANRLSSLVGNSNVSVQRVIPTVTYNGSRTVVDFGQLYREVTLPVGVTTVEDAYIVLEYEVRRILTGEQEQYMSNKCPVKSLVPGERVDLDYPWVIFPLNYYYMSYMTYDVDMLVNTNLTIVNGSGSKLSTERLMGGVNGMDVLLKYSKLLGLYWVVNDYNKVIRVVRRSDYFYDCFNEGIQPKGDSVNGFMDLSERIDNESIVVKPLPWDEKNVVMNFAVGENTYSKEYEERYGLSYGSVRVVTENDRNEETTELLCNSESDTIVAPIITEEYYRPLSSYTEGRDYKVKGDSYVEDEANTFLFRLPNSTYNAGIRGGWRVESDVAKVLITEDSSIENENALRCYHKTKLGNDMLTSVRPRFSDRNASGYSLLFGEPKEYYSEERSNEGIFKGLFEKEYLEYFTEVYNKRNKGLECSVWLTVEEYNKLKHNPFVNIGNVGYIVLEISDFRGTGWCKAVMRQIDNYERLFKKMSGTILRPVLGGVISGLTQGNNGVFKPTIESAELPGSGGDEEIIQPL